MILKICEKVQVLRVFFLKGSVFFKIAEFRPEKLQKMNSWQVLYFFELLFLIAFILIVLLFICRNINAFIVFVCKD